MDPKYPKTVAEYIKGKIKQEFTHISWELDFDQLAAQEPKEIARAFLGVIAIKFNVLLHLSEEVLEKVQNLLKDHRVMQTERESQEEEDKGKLKRQLRKKASRVFILTSSPTAEKKKPETEEKLPNITEIDVMQTKDTAENNSVIPNTEEFMIEILQVSAIAAIKFPNPFLNLNNCIQATNTLFSALKTESADDYEKVLEFLQQPPSTNSIWAVGSIRQKEPHTYVLESSVGPIQIGIPPETIKTSMKKGELVPQIYVLPPNLFMADENFGEVEFPIYFNFFIKQACVNPEKRMILIGHQEHLDRVQAVFRESFYGPDADHMFVDEEVSPQKKSVGYTINLKAERETIASKNDKGEPTPISDFAVFLAFDKDGIAVFKQKTPSGDREVSIQVWDRQGLIQFFEDGQHKASLDTNLTPHAHACKDESHKHGDSKDEEEESIATIFDPPTLGITFLGTSHGFDAKGNTTGFIIWINGSGILVDPPIRTHKYLKKNGIKASTVKKVILTHCHSDHDSGILRQIMGGERIELHTTKTIHESYKRKMNAITGLNIGDFYDFVPVPIGKIIKILGASFEFDYSFHTIPTIRFKLQYGGRSISYSSDAYYNPELYAQLRDQKIITPEREVSLRMFLFDADLIIHEAGIPPIHTPIAMLNELPSTIKKKMMIVHCNSIPATVEKVSNGKKITVPVRDLKIPACGLTNTIRLQVGEYIEGFSHANRRFRMFSEIFFFRDLPPQILYELYFQSEEETIQEGEVIINSGEESDFFYIIERGKVDIYNGKAIKPENLSITLQRGDTFGENALRRARSIPRSATVVARTECVLLKIQSQMFKNIVTRDGEANIEKKIDGDISRMSRMRPFVKEVLSKTYLFQGLTPDQINYVSAILDRQNLYRKDQFVIHEGDTDRSLFLIESGSIRLVRQDESGDQREIMRMGVGEIFGELSLITGLPRTCSVIANEDCVILELTKEAFDKLLNQYQNLRVKLAILVEQRLKESQKVGVELKKSFGKLQI